MIKFTKAESVVVELLKTGKKNGEMAEDLKVTGDTIKFHLTNVYRKYNATSRSEFLVKYYRRKGAA